jgi:hypothetical protein
MAGEMQGKRIFIQRSGRRAFELPEQHTAEVLDHGGSIGQVVALATPLEGGQYYLEGIDEETDRFILHVGEPLAMSDPPGRAEGPIPKVRGYPFMDD